MSDLILTAIGLVLVNWFVGLCLAAYIQEGIWNKLLLFTISYLVAYPGFYLIVQHIGN